MIKEDVFLDELKSKTQALHKRVEQTALSKAIVSPAVTLDEYKRYLQKMWLLHAAAENILFPILSPYMKDLAERRKSGNIRSDLQALHSAVETGEPGKFLDAQFNPSPSFCFGMLYVLEGSTLGGLHIVKNVMASLGKDAAAATSFLTVYGAHTGSKWKEFLQVLNVYRQSVKEEEAAELIDGAIYAFNRTFELFNTSYDH